MTALHELKRIGKRASRRVGRGQSSTRGKQSGRGTKGQSARAGNKKRPELRDLIKKLPKRRGYGKNRARTINPARRRAVTVALSTIEKRFDKGVEVTPLAIRTMGLAPVRPVHPVKIVGNRIDKAVKVVGCSVSASAKEAIEKAGGSVVSA